MAHHAFGCWHGDRRLADKYGEAFDKVRGVCLCVLVCVPGSVCEVAGRTGRSVHVRATSGA